MQLYSAEDLHSAKRSTRRRELALGGALVALLAVYVLLLVRGRRGGMLVVLLAAFALCVFVGDTAILPARRYLRFLKELQAGQRRSASGVLSGPAGEPQLQDGAWVCAVQLRMADGESRVFYWNEAKLNCLPPVDVPLRLECCGRHVLAWEAP